jgi:transposase
MAAKKRAVTGGVDTHGKTHHAAAVDQTGRVLADQEFAATAAGYQALLAWLRALGRVMKVGVEGTGTYGAGLARDLAAQDVELVEVDRPDRKTRRNKGKSDPIDAIAAARAALSGQAAGAPKTRTGPVEAIRALRPPRRGQGPHRRAQPTPWPDHLRPRAATRRIGQPSRPASLSQMPWPVQILW